MSCGHTNRHRNSSLIKASTPSFSHSACIIWKLGEEKRREEKRRMTLHSIVIQKLLSTNAHLGKRVAHHHLKEFAYGLRNSQTIIDSDKTLVCLRSATNFIANLARDPHSRFLFVNTNPLFDEIVEQMTKKIGFYSPRDRMLWKLTGFLTNSSSPKKFKSRNKKFCLGLLEHPDCVVVLDPERRSSVIREADKMQIPVVALVDLSTPWEYYKKIAYPVPANDSVEFVYLFCNIITKTILLERKKVKALKGESKDDLEALSKSEEARKILQMVKEGEVLFVPYQSLAPTPGGVGEIKKLLDSLVVVKFNDTLGNAMGFLGPKSAMEIRDGMSHLDLVINQIESLNSKHGCQVSLLLMNTEETHEDTQKVLKKHSVPFVDVLQISQGQGLQQESLDGGDGYTELYPTNHSVVFLSLLKSGMLDELLLQGKEFIYIIGSDNVAAAVDQNILNYLIQNKIEYCMEVTPTISDNLHNQESVMVKLAEIWCNPNDKIKARDKFKFVDTRSSWVDLKSVKRLVGTDGLKMVEGRESLSSSAVRLFNQAIAVDVPRSRFVPLNSTSDLLLLQSDLYSMVEGTLVWNRARANPENPSINLGFEFEKVDEFQSRFKSIPSIIDLTSLKVTGDVWFGSNVTLKGKVSITAKPGVTVVIPDGKVLENVLIRDQDDI